MNTTPRPWFIETACDHRGNDHLPYITSNHIIGEGDICDLYHRDNNQLFKKENAEGNAQLIVDAVNSHVLTEDELRRLIAMVQKEASMLEHYQKALSVQFKTTGLRKIEGKLKSMWGARE